MLYSLQLLLMISCSSRKSCQALQPQKYACLSGQALSQDSVLCRRKRQGHGRQCKRFSPSQTHPHSLPRVRVTSPIHTDFGVRKATVWYRYIYTNCLLPSRSSSRLYITGRCPAISIYMVVSNTGLAGTSWAWKPGHCRRPGQSPMVSSLSSWQPASRLSAACPS